MLQKPVIQERDCEICGYQLRGMPKHALSVCPECGSVFDAQRLPSKWRYATWTMVPVCVAVIWIVLQRAPYDKFGVPTSVLAGIVILLAMCGTVAFSVVSVLLARMGPSIESRWLVGLGIGLAVCFVSTCLGWCATV